MRIVRIVRIVRIMRIIYINKIDTYKRVLIPTTNGHPVP